jgi:hypothetical protein
MLGSAQNNLFILDDLFYFKRKATFILQFRLAMES